MTKKTFIVIAVISFLVANIADLVDAVVSGTLLGGKSGFPFTDDRTTVFGGGTSDNFMFFLNWLFWFILIFIIWKVLLRIRKK